MAGLTEDRATWLARNVLPHEPALRAWLTRWPRSGLDIDDIVQETYAILASRASVAEIRNPKTYCFQTARSIILMHLRRSRVVSILAVENIDRLGRAGDDISAEEQLSSREELHLLAEAIAALPRPGRDALTLIVTEGLSHREIGARLGISENATQKHVAKSIHLLMGALGGGKVRSDASKGGVQGKRSRHAGAGNSRGD